MTTLEQAIEQLEAIVSKIMGQMDEMKKDLTAAIDRHLQVVAEKERYRVALLEILQMQTSEDCLVAECAKRALNLIDDERRTH